jgi:hypothetical protein
VAAVPSGLSHTPLRIIIKNNNTPFGSKTWYLTLMEKWLVFENRLLKKIFGPRSEEILVKWGKLHNEKLRNLFLPFTKYLLR